MREEVVSKIDDVLWEDFLVRGGLKKKTLKEIVSRVKEIEPELEEAYINIRKHDPDNRIGVDTYGYDNIDSIKRNLEFVSDRWMTAFRVKWILDLIHQDISKLK
jgi:hypothetical protein